MQFYLKRHQKRSTPKTHSSIAPLVRHVQHKHRLLCEIAMQFSSAPSCYLFNLSLFPTMLLYENAHSFSSPVSRSWCLPPSTWTAMSWQSPTTCLFTIIPSTGGGLGGLTPRKVRPLIWNMVGDSFSLVGIATFNCDFVCSLPSTPPHFLLL